MYLTGASNRLTIAAAAQGAPLGIMLQPGNSYARQVQCYPRWAADTGCFAHPEAFDAEQYLAWLASIPHPERCLFATAPDRFGDGIETLRVAPPVLLRIAHLGLPAALVAQPGMTSTSVPWDLVDVLFVGGPNEWQYSDELWGIANEASLRGVPIHVGRVNSLERLRFARLLGARSADGTYAAFGPDLNVPRLLRWLSDVNAQLTL